MPKAICFLSYFIKFRIKLFPPAVSGEKYSSAGMLILLALISQLWSGSGGTQLVFQVHPGTEECFYQTMSATKSLTVEYQVPGSIHLHDITDTQFPLCHKTSHKGTKFP